MTLAEIYAHADKIGCMAFSTLCDDSGHLEIQSRIAHFFAFDNNGLYLRTMAVKPFYHQLKKHGQLTVSGIYPSGSLTGHNEAGEPFFQPGFAFRLTGAVRELDAAEISTRAATNPDFKTLLFDINKYPNTRGFCLYQGKGEIFDYDFEGAHRDHKLERTRFHFGGLTAQPSGCSISDACIGCGACAQVCTFKAIEPTPNNTYRIRPERCDECGSCTEVCPANAILPGLAL